MSAHSQEFSDQLAAYLLGALDGEELSRLEEHLEGGCSECEAGLAEWSSVAEEMAAGSGRAVEPSETTRRRILGRVAGAPLANAVPSSVTGSIGSKLVPVTLAASWILLAWSGWSQFELRGELATLASERQDTARELRQVRQELSQTRATLDQTVLANRVVSAPQVQSVRLAGLEAAPRASARTYLDPATGRAVFYASNLEEQPEDRTYQLWFIADGAPVSGGVFAVDAEGGASLVVENVAPPQSIQAWAVTVEPAGGVPQPTGEMVLKG